MAFMEFEKKTQYFPFICGVLLSLLIFQHSKTTKNVSIVGNVFLFHNHNEHWNSMKNHRKN